MRTGKIYMYKLKIYMYKLAFSCGYILVGLEEMTPTFGDVYVVSMIDHWCSKHLLEAVVVGGGPVNL